MKVCTRSLVMLIPRLWREPIAEMSIPINAKLGRCSVRQPDRMLMLKVRSSLLISTHVPVGENIHTNQS